MIAGKLGIFLFRRNLFHKHVKLENFLSNIFIENKFSTRPRMSKTALVLLANGAEEMEFVISVDVLRRGGVDVTVAGVEGPQPVKCSREVTIVPDVGLEDIANRTFDVVVLPGGLGGAKLLASSGAVGSLLRSQEKAGKLIAAICAAPTALKSHGVGLGKLVTSYPSFKEQMTEGSKYQYSEDKVVVDGDLITSRGPGTAFDFALAIVRQLVGNEKAEAVAKGMLL